MGRYRTRQYEDPDFKLSPEEARAGDPVARLMPAILERNGSLPMWGWKRPNSIYYIRSVHHLLVNPVYLFVYRNLESIARSSAKHDGRNWEEEGPRLLEVARKHSEMVKQFSEELPPEVEQHSFEVEEILADPSDFAEEISRIVGIASANPAKIASFIDPNGGYHRTSGFEGRENR